MHRSCGFAALLSIVVALTGCGRDGGTNRAPNASRRSDGGSHATDGRIDEPALSPAATRKLFADAAHCSNRYKCAPLSELHRLVGGDSGRAVVTVAFDLMAKGQIRRIDREGMFTHQIVGEWLLERRNTKTLDRDTAAWCMAQIKRAAATCDPSLVDGLELLAVNSELPGAIDWVEKGITDPQKPLAEACADGRFLSQFLKDYARVQRWLKTAGDNGLCAAICALHRFDHDLFDVQRDELPLLERAASRANLAPEIAYPLLNHVEIHGTDARFRAIAGRLTRHPNDGIRRRAAALAK
jgi:hypothetical protein